MAGMGYTRDLYWCVAGGSEVCPASAENLLQALLWVLGERPMDALEDIAAAEHCATSLAAHLTPFQEDPVLPTGEAALGPQPSGTFGVREWQEERGSTVARYQAAARAVQGWAAALSGADLEAGAAKGPRRSLAGANIRGQVASYDWAQEDQRRLACQELERAREGQGMESVGPMVLVGAADTWPACSRWSLSSLVRREGRWCGMVRVSNSSDFIFCQEHHIDVLRGIMQPPSWRCDMSLAEFAMCIQRSSSFVQRGLRFYLQAGLNDALLQDINVKAAPFSIIGDASPSPQSAARKSNSGRPLLDTDAATEGVAMTQSPRMWMSPAGTVSPLHYDSSASFLTQVRGRKKLVFYSPAALSSLYPYPDDHPLRRRCQVDITQAEGALLPLSESIAGLEVELAPGDVLFFPPRWAHYTESLDFSISVTCRFQA